MEIKYNGITKISYNLFEYCVREVNGNINEKIWQSLYNSYITYDYEPTCLDGLVLNLDVSFPTDFHRLFFEQLYKGIAGNVNYLEKCLKVSSLENDFFKGEDAK